MCWSASSVRVYFPCVHRGQSPLVLPSLSYIQPFLSVPHWCCRSCSWGPSWRLLLTDSSAGARWSRPRCPAPGLKAPCRSPPGWRPGRGGTPDCRWRLHPACKWGIGCWWCRAPGASACRSRHRWNCYIIYSRIHKCLPIKEPVWLCLVLRVTQKTLGFLSSDCQTESIFGISRLYPDWF